MGFDMISKESEGCGRLESCAKATSSFKRDSDLRGRFSTSYAEALPEMIRC